MHRVFCGADEKQLLGRFPALGIPEEPWSQALLPELPHSSLHVNVSISPWLSVHSLPKGLQQPPPKVSQYKECVIQNTK